MLILSHVFLISSTAIPIRQLQLALKYSLWATGGVGNV
jgi:hypothetical protein